MILANRSSVTLADEKYINLTTNNEAKGEKGKPFKVYQCILGLCWAQIELNLSECKPNSRFFVLTIDVQH